MTTSFSTINLADEKVLVSGTDKLGTTGKAVLDASEWIELRNKHEFDTAAEAFDAAVEEFFAPLTKAAEAASKSLEKPRDPAQYIVMQDQIEAVEGSHGVVLRLSKDSVVLNLIEAGDYDRLIWVGDNLEVTEYVPPTEDGEVTSLTTQQVVDMFGGDTEVISQESTGQARIED